MIINMQQGGVVPDRILDEQTITPNTANQVITAGSYLRGDLTILGDPDLIPENIPYDMNFFGIEGTRRNGFGKNVWAKYLYTPEETVYNLSFKATQPVISNAKNRFNISDPNYDTSRISNFTDFYDGFYRSDNSSYKFSKDGSTLYYKSSINEQVTLADATQIYFYTTTTTFAENVYTFKHAGPKTLNAIIGDLIDYVADDDISKYPDGAMHTDGYYYELLASASSTNAMSLSDNAVDAVSSQIVNEVSK